MLEVGEATMFDCLPPGKPPVCDAIVRRQGKAEGWDQKNPHFLPCIFVAYFTRSMNEQIKDLWRKHQIHIPHPQRAIVSVPASRSFL
jgi:hypothetical protein